MPATNTMTTTQKTIGTFSWGVFLWLMGYIAGIVLFFVVPKEYIGWVLTPFATLFTIWILLKRIKRPEMMCYFGLGMVWTFLAIMLDYVFLVFLLGTGASYYQLDIFLYYLLTLSLPPLVGYYKLKQLEPKKNELF